MMIGETLKPVPVGADLDLNSAAENDCDSINMSNYHRATFLIQYQTIGGAANYVKLYSGATNGAKTSALTFRYAFGSAAQGSANCDVLASWATSSNLSVAHGTYDNYMLVVDIMTTEMDLANNEEWLTLTFADTDTGATGNVVMFAILHPRHTKGQSESALA